MNTLKTLIIVLALVFISTLSNAEIRYLDEVKIVQGFYRGKTGIVQEETPGGYRIKLMSEGKIITVPIDEVEFKSRRRDNTRF